MSKYLIWPIILISFYQCSFLITKASRTGIFFPLEVEEKLSVEGAVNKDLKRENNRIYLSTKKGYLYCLDVPKKEFSWEHHINQKIISSPYLGQEHVYFFTEDELYSLDKKTGVLRWKVELKDKITTPVVENKGKVYFGTLSRNIWVLEAASGKILNKHQIDGPVYSGLAFWENSLIFGTIRGELCFLRKNGKLSIRFKAQQAIKSDLLVDDSLLYFGSNDDYFYCFNLKRKKIKWKVKTGADVISSPITDKKRIYFISLNNVLYCLNKKNGTILWWNIIPARSYYQLNLVGDKIIVTSLSDELLAFEIKEGKEKGKFKAPTEIKSNSIWITPNILVTIYDVYKKKGRLLFLKRKIAVKLKANKSSPQKIGEKITFTAAAFGLFEPQFEFYLAPKDKPLERIQEFSKNNSWDWYPEEKEDYIIKVIAKDNEHQVEDTISFSIVEEE
ncbi:MAG: PQQ-binding-like beta-propeller repeat protein [Candidatus Aminicenantia bacterium]